MAPRIFVVCSDSLGIEIVTRFAMIGEDVLAGVVGSQNQLSQYAYPQVKIIDFDFSSIEKLSGILSGIENIILCIPPDIDVSQTMENVLQIVKKTDVSHITFLSKFGVKTFPPMSLTSPYFGAEQKLIASKFPNTIVRPNFTMQKILSFISDDNKIYLPFIYTGVSYIDERDVAAAVAEIALLPEKHLRKTYDLTGLENKTIKQIAEIFSSVTGEKFTCEDNENALREIMQSQNVAAPLIDSYIKYFNLIKDGGAAKITNNFASITGSLPITFVDFTRDYAENIRKRNAA